MNAATSDLWKAFGGRLRRFIAARVRNEHDIDDILQETFIRIHAGLETVRSEEKLEPWIFQVTRRTVIDHFRKRFPAGLPVEPAGTDAAPAAASELASCLTPMMELLEEPDREALRLTDLDGFGQKELALRLGLSLTGAKSRVQRARQRLKEILLDCCQIELDRRGNPFRYAPRSSSCSCG